MTKKIPKEREWITINGRKLLWSDFIYSVVRDFFAEINNFSDLNPMKGKSKRILHLLEDWTIDYTRGTNDIDIYKDVLDKYNISIEERKLPEAIDDLFFEFQKTWSSKIDTKLDMAQNNSEVAYQIMKKEQELDNSRKQIVKKICDNYQDHDDSVVGKIKFLMYLQEAKNKCSYDVSKDQLDRECVVTELWISILVHSVSSEFITHAQMLLFVQNGLLEEKDFDDLLRYKYNEERDYKWYSEDFLGLDLSHSTIIRIDDVLDLVESSFRDILGF